MASGNNNIACAYGKWVLKIALMLCKHHSWTNAWWGSPSLSTCLSVSCHEELSQVTFPVLHELQQRPRLEWNFLIVQARHPFSLHITIKQSPSSLNGLCPFSFSAEAAIWISGWRKKLFLSVEYMRLNICSLMLSLSKQMNYNMALTRN